MDGTRMQPNFDLVDFLWPTSYGRSLMVNIKNIWNNKKPKLRQLRSLWCAELMINLSPLGRLRFGLPKKLLNGR